MARPPRLGAGKRRAEARARREPGRARTRAAPSDRPARRSRSWDSAPPVVARGGPLAGIGFAESAVDLTGALMEGRCGTPAPATMGGGRQHVGAAPDRGGPEFDSTVSPARARVRRTRYQVTTA